MSRFATARALFAEFPTLARMVKVKPTDDDPRRFIRAAAADGALRDAAAVCAYCLPKREAVWWLCGALRTRSGMPVEQVDAIAAAEAWARAPSEPARERALERAKSADQEDAATWAAYAAGFTSGVLATMPDGPVRTPQYLTHECARVSLVLAECRLPLEQAKPFLRDAVDAALRLLEEGTRRP